MGDKSHAAQAAQAHKNVARWVCRFFACSRQSHVKLKIIKNSSSAINFTVFLLINFCSNCVSHFKTFRQNEAIGGHATYANDADAAAAKLRHASADASATAAAATVRFPFTPLPTITATQQFC